jgi:hypothetical protein
MFPPPIVLFAQETAPTPPAKSDPKDAIKSDTLWITVGLLALILVVGAVVVAMVDRWRKRTPAFDKASVEEVTNFREMFESGEITHAEYEKIRSKMATRVKTTVGVKPGDPPAPPGPADAPPPGNST